MILVTCDDTLPSNTHHSPPSTSATSQLPIPLIPFSITMAILPFHSISQPSYLHTIVPLAKYERSLPARLSKSHPDRYRRCWIRGRQKQLDISFPLPIWSESIRLVWLSMDERKEVRELDHQKADWNRRKRSRNRNRIWGWRKMIEQGDSGGCVCLERTKRRGKGFEQIRRGARGVSCQDSPLMLSSKEMRLLPKCTGQAA